MLLPQPKQNLSLQICYIFSNTLRKHQLKLQHLQGTLLSKIAIVKSFIQGLLMLIRGTQSCFKFRIIFTERRCKYLFVTNIFGNFFIVCRKTISHGFSFYGVRVRFIFHISVEGFFILRKFIVTLFRVAYVFNMFAICLLAFRHSGDSVDTASDVCACATS